MSKSKFMRRAIEISREQMLLHGAAPFAAVIVKDGTIVGEGCNNVVNQHDATSHGEVEAIRDAGRHLQTWDLSGCDIYTTCEPCEMCVAAIHWARLDRMFYSNALSDAEDCGFDLTALRTIVRADIHDRAIPTERVLPEEGRAVLDLWKQQPGFNVFQS